MESKKCESCLREEIPICAEFWCFDCEEPLCKECLRGHRKNKFLVNHHTVDLDFMDIFPTETLSAILHCSKHGDSRIDLFCADHETLCCRHCMTESHRTCQSILPIDIASKNIKTSPLPAMLAQDLTVYLQTLNTLIHNREESSKTFEKMVGDIECHIQSFKASIVDHLDKLEKLVVDYLRDFTVEEREVSRHSLGEICENRKLYHRNKSDHDVVLQYGSDSQIFLFTHHLSQQLAKDELDIQQKTQNLTDVTVTFAPDHRLPDIVNTLGNLKIHKQPCSLEPFPLNRRNAQVKLRPRLTSKTQYFYQSQIDISCSENAQITAIAVTGDNRIILCNRNCNKLLVYSESGKFLQDCIVNCKPWDIAILPDGNRAVVTIPLENSIQFVNISAIIADREPVRLHCKCHGVAVVSNSIVVGANRELYILELDGTIKTRVQVPGQLIYFLCAGDNRSVYYTDYHSVYHVNMDGTEIFRYNHPDLKVPEGIARDNQGCLFVTGRGSQNVHCVSIAGNLVDIPLTRVDGIVKPWAISFNKECNKAFISTHDGKSISVFDIQRKH